MFRRIFDVIILLFIAFVLYRQVPVWLNSYRQEGKAVQSVSVWDLDGRPVVVPVAGQRTILILWATWCGPCHQQLALFKSAVEKGDLTGESIIALSMGESIADVKSHQLEHRYPFQVLADPDGVSRRYFDVLATPSLAFVDEELTVRYFASGLSPMAPRRAKEFLQPDQ